MLAGLREATAELLRAQVSTHISDVRLRRTRALLAVAWLIALAVWIETRGIPYHLQGLLIWLAMAMFVASIANPLGWARSMAVDWLPFYLILLCYGIVWGLVDNLGRTPQAQPQLNFDQMLFGHDGLVASLQQTFWSGHVDALDYMVWVVYMSHFVLTTVVCAVLWMRSRQQFLAYRRRVVATWLGGLLVFALYPTVPPWMAGESGLIPHVTRIIGAVNRAIAPEQTERVLSDGGGKIDLANPVAAVPSLHAALPMLLLFFLWNRVPLLRPLLVAYPTVMAFTLIYAGEHYLFDILAGFALAGGVHIACNWYERRRGQHRVAYATPRLPRTRGPQPTQRSTDMDHVMVTAAGGPGERE